MGASGIQPHHQIKAQEAQEASASLKMFLELANGDVSLVNIIESDNEWPGAFASIRRHQEENFLFRTVLPYIVPHGSSIPRPLA